MTITIPTGTYIIDPSHSELSFSVRHAGIAKVRGRFAEFEGSIVVGPTLSESSARAAIIASSVDTGDANRDNHLRSGDFFSVETRPTWTFVSTGTRGAADEFVLDGDLTINGITRPVALEVEFNGAATDPYGNERIAFSASADVNRKDFNLTWNVALEAGGVLVGEKVKLSLEVSAVKQA